MQASHYARQDIMLALFVVSAYGLALWSFKNNRWWGHLLAGFLVGVAVDVHQNAVLFAAGLAALYLFNYKKNALRQPALWWCALGGLLGLLEYAAIHILPNPQAYLAVYSTDLSGTGSHTLPILSLNPYDWLSSIRGEFSRFHILEYGLDFALIAGKRLMC